MTPSATRLTLTTAALVLAAIVAQFGSCPGTLSAQSAGDPDRAPPRPEEDVGQQPGDWNDVRVLRLVERARDQRASATVDSEVTSYQARALGHVYFFVDRPDSATNVLVKGDQVALDLFWRAPNETQQWIVGMRDEKVLPTGIRYHLDHLTVVQDDFGDFIRLGDGDEVEAVVHPVGPRAESVYDFLLSDSLSLSYAGGLEEVRVYEISVRPKNLDGPGYVGTLFVDRDRAAIVRMNFSFTAASYVDPYLDYIRISLDNSLWLGTHWLPYRQEVEIRREIPYFDFMAGSTIRSTFDIRDYDFNVDIDDDLFLGTGVRSVSPNQRRSFAFERGIFEELEESGGIGPSVKMEEVREQVRGVVEDEVLSGLSGFRLYAARLSDFARYNRAEGIYLGAGITLRPRGELQIRTTAGYAIGRDRPSGAVSVGGGGQGMAPTLDLYWDAMGDIGGNPGATPLENSISSASGSKDYLDPFFRRGGTLRFGHRPASRWTLSLSLEEHGGARDVVSDGPDTEFRPVRSIEEGTLASASLGLRTGLPGRGSAQWIGTGGVFDGRQFGSIAVEAAWDLGATGDPLSGRVSAEGALTNPDAPPQTLYLIGGRYTLPGHDYREFAGNAYWLVRSEVTVPVYPPYLGVRAIGSLGAAYLNGVELPPDWSASGASEPKASVGLGLSFGWDAMRFDVARGLGGGGWEAVFSVAPKFRNWL